MSRKLGIRTVTLLAAALAVTMSPSLATAASAAVDQDHQYKLLSPGVVTQDVDYTGTLGNKLWSHGYVGAAQSGWWTAVGVRTQAAASTFSAGRGLRTDTNLATGADQPQFAAFDRNGACSTVGDGVTGHPDQVLAKEQAAQVQTEPDVKPTFDINVTKPVTWQLSDTTNRSLSLLDGNNNPVAIYDIYLNAGQRYLLRMQQYNKGGVFLLDSEPTCRTRTRDNATVALTSSGEQYFTVGRSGWQGLVVLGAQLVQVTT